MKKKNVVVRELLLIIDGFFLPPILPGIFHDQKGDIACHIMIIICRDPPRT